MECEYMTAFGCSARDYVKELMLQELVNGSEEYKELDNICKKQCCVDCKNICGYRCGRA